LEVLGKSLSKFLFLVKKQAQTEFVYCAFGKSCGMFGFWFFVLLIFLNSGRAVFNLAAQKYFSDLFEVGGIGDV
jgi:cell division protein FtsW (lipid II flippase)